ncbi:hypothetical protein TIFTF001_012288 [Ficus carica]|uniref:Uncharacterized protein n=1 Tax=Ficus carica TaxID=3494 RepID=A0AA87ZZR6_FICCA|nr:hypothetical protein TIFTF001_012288 [Ficus carica]
MPQTGPHDHKKISTAIDQIPMAEISCTKSPQPLDSHLSDILSQIRDDRRSLSKGGMRDHQISLRLEIKGQWGGHVGRSGPPWPRGGEPKRSPPRVGIATRHSHLERSSLPWLRKIVVRSGREREFVLLLGRERKGGWGREKEKREDENYKNLDNLVFLI